MRRMRSEGIRLPGEKGFWKQEIGPLTDPIGERNLGLSGNVVLEVWLYNLVALTERSGLVKSTAFELVVRMFADSGKGLDTKSVSAAYFRAKPTGKIAVPEGIELGDKLLEELQGLSNKSGKHDELPPETPELVSTALTTDQDGLTLHIGKDTLQQLAGKLKPGGCIRVTFDIECVKEGSHAIVQ